MKSVKDKSSAPQQGMSQKTGEPIQDSRLAEFFHDELKDIYWAEKHLVKTLPKMSKAATSAVLKKAFDDHLVQTKGHCTRLENVFGILGKKPQAKKCDAMDGITKEGQSIIDDTEAGTATRDVGLIMAGQKAEHYEIATYGALIQLAKTLGYSECADLMLQTLNEEKKADEGLTDVAENGVNYDAASEPDKSKKKSK